MTLLGYKAIWACCRVHRVLNEQCGLCVTAEDVNQIELARLQALVASEGFQQIYTAEEGTPVWAQAQTSAFWMRWGQA